MHGPPGTRRIILRGSATGRVVMSSVDSAAPKGRIAMAIRPVKAPYFFQDPIRLSAIICAALLMWMKDVPVPLGLFAAGRTQVNGLAMIVDNLGRGWSLKWGDRARSTVFTSRLTSDWVNESVCTLVGAMLLMKMFGGPGPLVTAL